MAGYRSLEVYQKAYKLSLRIHKETLTLPAFERYELGSQLRRAAVSITLNIAEGYGRRDSSKEFNHFLRHCMGSCNEVQVLLDLVKDIGYISEQLHNEFIAEYEILGRQLYRLKSSLTEK